MPELAKSQYVLCWNSKQNYHVNARIAKSQYVLCWNSGTRWTICTSVLLNGKESEADNKRC